MPEGLFGMVMGYSLMPDNGGQEPSCVAASRRAAAGAHCAGDLDKALSPTALLGPPHSAVAKCVFNSYIAAEEAEAQRGLVTSPTHIDHTGCKW